VDLSLGLWFADRLLGWRQSRRKLRVLAHRAVFAQADEEQLFVKVTNLSTAREVEVTNIWFDTTPQIDLLNPDCPLPARLRLDETFETWKPLAELPDRPDLERLVRVRLSNGKTVRSRLNRDVRPIGHVAGRTYVASLGTAEPTAVTGIVPSAQIPAAALDPSAPPPELRPRFRATCQRLNPGGDQLRLVIELMGPPDLEHLDELTVTIRDDKFHRLKPVSRPDIPSTDQVPDHVWGPVRFVPGTGPGVTTRPGAVGADRAGRTTRSVGMPVGEAHVYALEPNPPPPGAAWTTDGWRAEVGTTLRLQIDGCRDGWKPWRAVGEIDAGGDPAVADIPS
jgi:hypothetical protein